MSERTAALEQIVAMRPHIAVWRDRAIMACMLSPAHWIAVHGVPLTDYLGKLNDLDEIAARAESELRAAPAP